MIEKEEGKEVRKRMRILRKREREVIKMKVMERMKDEKVEKKEITEDDIVGAFRNFLTRSEPLNKTKYLNYTMKRKEVHEAMSDQ